MKIESAVTRNDKYYYARPWAISRAKNCDLFYSGNAKFTYTQHGQAAALSRRAGSLRLKANLAAISFPSNRVVGQTSAVPGTVVRNTDPAFLNQPSLAEKPIDLLSVFDYII